jgi:hypothetical protein
MVPLTTLWLPILVSGVVVFIASSVIHMVLPFHRSDYKKLGDEEKVLDALRAAGVQRGLYNFPFTTHKEMKTPEMQERFKKGPVGFVTIFPGSPAGVSLVKFLVLWFVYCLLVGLFAAYLACHAIDPGAPYRHVFRIVGTAAFMSYGLANFSNGIWKGQPWPIVVKEMIGGLIYALLTAGTFGWLWPR